MVLQQQARLQDITSLKILGFIATKSVSTLIHAPAIDLLIVHYLEIQSDFKLRAAQRNLEEILGKMERWFSIPRDLICRVQALLASATA
ncbi:MAG: hypothetical protein A2X46_05255 [Lentisphaerae bacterium GWF2_57_35]|nr:MAG: hypothetical protein A2X46_05255 [Lentisphaerae bacterium GWF2_57_35]